MNVLEGVATLKNSLGSSESLGFASLFFPFPLSSSSASARPANSPYWENAVAASSTKAYLKCSRSGAANIGVVVASC